MIEASKDPYIFDTIAKAFKSGKTMETWLASTGKNHGLANTIAGLQSQWDAWLGDL